ncbi:winged helix-turn-helix domain-containing protein [Methanocella conradii]|uniref:winged helix-turn-helix domain-containing protein n=1 Tax=Methanocella conradii TaxID=1175444 RepID=UPI00157D0491|nr:winged helix-turn-helix domain-containing protein [Methanocella conradii]
MSKEELENAYNREKDAETRNRILLVLRVKHDGVIPAHAARELHRSRAWATIWLQRFEEKRLEGLRTAERSGRPMKLDHHEFVSMKRMVVKNECGWTVKDVREMIHKETDVTYSERHTYRLMQKWGVRAIVPDKRLLHKASIKERLAFKKRTLDSSEMSQRGSQSFPKTNPYSF